MNFEELKHKLTQKSVSRIVNEHVLSSNPVCFNAKPELIWEIKEAISKHFHIHKKNIEIVGSAKLGVSLSEERLGEDFENTSDIDLAVVSDELFNAAWNELLEMEFDWYKLSQPERDAINDNYKTIPRGFVSPERLPKNNFKEKWWQVFSTLSNKSKYEHRKIRGRLFKNWWFVEKYYSIQISNIKNKKA